MNTREFNYHQYLAQLGYTDPVVCSSDPDHGNLYASIDSEDTMYLYCLVCNYKLRPGSEFSSIIDFKIRKITKEIVDAELAEIAKRLPPRS